MAKRKTGRNAHMRYAARATSSAALAPRPSNARRARCRLRVAWKVPGASVPRRRRSVDARHGTGTRDTRHVREAYRRDRRRRVAVAPPRPSRAPTPTRGTASAAASESVVCSLQKSGAASSRRIRRIGGGFRARRREDIRGRDSVQVGDATCRFTPCTSPRVAHGDPLRSSRAPSRAGGPRTRPGARAALVPGAPPTPRLFLSGPKPENP